MIITFVNKYSKKISVLHLPSKINGKFWIKEKNKSEIVDIIGIEAIGDKWVAFSNQNYSLAKNSENLLSNIIIKPLRVYKVINNFDKSEYYFYTEPSTKDRITFKKYYIDENTKKISIGSDEKNDIIYKMFEAVSGEHATLEKKNGMWVLKDENSRNFTFYNDEILINDSVLLQFGDIVTVLGLKIVVGNDFIAINNPDNTLIINNDNIKRYTLPDSENIISNNVSPEISCFYRSPRLKYEIIPPKIKVEPPPQKQTKNDIPMVMTLGSSLTMGLASLANGFLTIYTSKVNGNDWLSCMPTLIMSGSMVLGTITWPIILQITSRKKEKLNENKRCAIYMNYIGNLKAELNKEMDKQTEFLNQNYPSPISCIERTINKDSKLWERSFFDNDFLSIRLGLGDTPLNINMSFPDEKMTLADDSLSDEMFRIANENWNITDVPVPFSLYKNRLVGVIGEHKSIFAFFYSIILQICTLHSYNEVKIVLLADEKNIDEWGYVRFLPHLFSDDRQNRYVAASVSEVQNIDIMMKKIISERNEQRNDSGSVNKKIPHYVIMFLQDYRKVNLKSCRELIENSEKIGVSMIFFSEQYEALPVECKAIINIDKTDAGSLYSDILSSKDDVTFKVDIFEHDKNTDYSIALANTYLELNFNSKGLPKSITFLEMMNVSKVEHLNVAQKWSENTGASTLAVPIGIDNDGNKFILDLHENAHGPHGLIAGMTGSGKSEFSITYILSLAIHYSPDTVAFLLIDYKGAGLTGAFENKDPEHAFRLPHLAGTITNLDGSAIQRAVVSIDTELKRRQEIFRETTQKYDTGTMNIYQYQKLYRDGKVSVPLPHLFIISDEFAELKKQEPEFMDKLISTARIGRSLGVHLILATQKPAGVVNEQIWSNSKFRVCLKVQERADSVEVIKRPDAASLSVVGRFYLQVGYNELFSLGQSAWSGASYIPEQDFIKKDTREVQLIDYSGNVLDSKRVTSLYEKVESNNSEKQETQLTAIVNYIIHIAESMNFKPYNLWEEPLSGDIMMSELNDSSFVISDMNEIKFVIGKWDNLYQRKQPVLTSSLTNNGNVVVYGSAQSGKQMFVQAAVDSMMMMYTSNRLHIYILDFDSEVLKEYIGFPQIGDVISDDESEKINNLFKMLQQKIKQRKKLLSSTGGSFSRYNNANKNILPSIVVIIHNYVKFAENYSNLVEKVAELMQETKCGIYFIITTSETNCFTSKVRQQLSQVYCLQLNQEAEYSSLLGRTQGLKPQKLKGRGLFKKKIDGLDKDVFEFQTVQLCSELQREDILIRFRKKCIERCKGIPYADKVLVLPDKINIDTSADVMFDIKNMFIGYNYSSMKPEYINIHDEYIHCIFAADQNSLIPFSQGLAEFISYCTSQSSESSNDIVYVIDPQGMYYEDNNKKYKYINENINITLNTLLTEAQRRNEILTAYEKAHEEGRDTNEENIKFPLIVCIIVSYSGLQMKLSEEEWNIFSEILRYSRQLGFRFEIFSDSSSAGSFMDSEWYTRYAKNNTTLWVGEGLRSQMRISWKGRLQEPFRHMSDSYGYAIRNGKTVLVKLIATYLKEEETF